MECNMNRNKALRCLLVLLVLICVGGVVAVVSSVRSGGQAKREDVEPMGLSLYVMMGIFLLVAARNPSANRGVIVFAAWLNIAHAAVMAVMAVYLSNKREGMLSPPAVFVCIGGVPVPRGPATPFRDEEGRT